MSNEVNPIRISIGPRFVGHGSWEWVGGHLIEVLSGLFQVEVFEQTPAPCDLLILVKHPVQLDANFPPKIIYFPIDRYGSAQEIADDRDFLLRCDRIVVHSHNLEEVFRPYGDVSYLDHPLNFVTPPRLRFREDGPLLWTGVRSNLAPVIDWLNSHPLPHEVVLLTNLEDSVDTIAAEALGLLSHNQVRIENWSRERHLNWMQTCRAAFDVKGNDFRACHKPPAKAMDFLASGIPFAINRDSSPAEHLRLLGFEVAVPEDVDRWLSREYFESVQRVLPSLQATLSPDAIASEVLELVHAVTSSDKVQLFSSVLESAPEDRVRQDYDNAVAFGDITTLYHLLQKEEKTFITQFGVDRWNNDLAVVEALMGQITSAQTRFPRHSSDTAMAVLARANVDALLMMPSSGQSVAPPASPPLPRRRIAILSLLYNWPSTGGGTVHTAELVKFLALAGYEVAHFCATYEPWGIGQILDSPSPVTQIHFALQTWNAANIQQEFRRQVDRFQPDFCIVTSSWNFKPLLAEAVSHYPYILRYAALENLCPLNNVRLLPDGKGGSFACHRHQLATPHDCLQCVRANELFSGSLHQAERALSGYGTPEYTQRLYQAVANATAVFVVNPLIASMFGPYAKQVRVVPSGFDPDRFPSLITARRNSQKSERVRVLFAGLTNEYMKGFHILRAAANQLWQSRQDFEIVVTADAPSETPPWATYVGWQSQEELPALMNDCDMLVFPTVAEEALGRSAVEAMGCGLPVIASRIGGLRFVVSDGGSGLLFTPGDVNDLAAKLDLLLSNPQRRREMGLIGRTRFENEFLWDSIIQQHYVEVCGQPHRN